MKPDTKEQELVEVETQDAKHERTETVESIDKAVEIHTQDTTHESKDEWPKTFTPAKFTSSLTELKEIITENANDNFFQRIFRLILIVFLFAVFLPVTYYFTKTGHIH
eukprot:95342_1